MYLYRQPSSSFSHAEAHDGGGERAPSRDASRAGPGPGLLAWVRHGIITHFKERLHLTAAYTYSGIDLLFSNHVRKYECATCHESMPTVLCAARLLSF